MADENKKLVDPSGKPIRSAELTRDLPAEEQTGLFGRKKTPRLKSTGLITPESVHAAVRAAEMGNTVKLMDLLLRIALDPRVSSDSDKRVGKLRMFNWTVDPYEAAGVVPSDSEIAIADEVRAAFYRIPRLARAIVHLGGGKLFAWALSEIRWDWVGDRFWPVQLVNRPSRNFRPLANNLFEKYTDKGWQSEPLPPCRYIAHAVEYDGSVILGGLLLRCVFAALAKQWTQTQWGKLLDLIGGGITDVTFKPEEDGKLSTAREIAETTGRQLWTAMSSAYEIERHFAKGNEAHGHQSFHHEANAAISEVLTGARLTTDPGEKGSRSLGVVHQDELDDLRAGDAADLAETITQQLVVPMVVFNFGPQEHYPEFKLWADDPVDKKLEAEVDEKLHGIGYPHSLADLRDRYGRAEPVDENDILPGKQQPEQIQVIDEPTTEKAAAASGKSRKFSVADAGGGDDSTTAPDEMFARDAALKQRALDVIEEADSLEAMLAGLRDLIAEVEREHTGRVAFELYRTMAIGHLAGRLADMLEHGELALSTRGSSPLAMTRQTRGSSPLAKAFATPIDEWADVTMDEAVDWFKRKGVVTEAEWLELEPGYRHRAFYAAKIGTANELRTAHNIILDGIQDGTSRQSVVRDLYSRLRDENGNPIVSRAYLRQLFDQNVANAQSYGRWQRQRETLDTRPFGRYLTMGDNDVRPEHAALHGTILPLSDGWWKANYPLNGYGCRCYVETLDQTTMDQRGWSVSDRPSYRAPEGWDVDPSQQASADERMNELARQTRDANSLLNGYQIPDKVIRSTTDDGVELLVGERSE